MKPDYVHPMCFRFITRLLPTRRKLSADYRQTSSSYWFPCFWHCGLTWHSSCPNILERNYKSHFKFKITPENKFPRLNFSNPIFGPTTEEPLQLASGPVPFQSARTHSMRLPAENGKTQLNYLTQDVVKIYLSIHHAGVVSGPRSCRKKGKKSPERK